MKNRLHIAMLETISKLSEELKPFLGLEHWDLRVEVGVQDDARASCTAQPEYQMATLTFDPDKLQTGDDLQEVVCHEHSHCLMWEIHQLAENQSKALQAQLDEGTRGAMGALMDEQVRQAGERAATRIGWTIIRMLRRIWQLEGELKDVKAKLRGYSNA